jgi:hypothetical protein
VACRDRSSRTGHTAKPGADSGRLNVKIIDEVSRDGMSSRLLLLIVEVTPKQQIGPSGTCMCEPPSDHARTAALWGWQAPDRDYPMSTDREDHAGSTHHSIAAGASHPEHHARYLRIATVRPAPGQSPEALHTMTAKEPALMPA